MQNNDDDPINNQDHAGLPQAQEPQCLSDDDKETQRFACCGKHYCRAMLFRHKRKMHPEKVRAYSKKQTEATGKIIVPDHFNKNKRPRQCLLDDDLAIDVIDATVQSDEEQYQDKPFERQITTDFVLKFIQQCSCGTVNAKLLRPCLPYFRLQQVMAEVNDLEPASLIDMMGQLEVSFLTEHELAGIVGITFAHGSQHALQTFQRLWNVISARAEKIKRTSVNILGQFLQDTTIADWLLDNVPYITTDIMQAVEHLRFYKTGNKRGVLDVLRLLDFTTCNLKEDLLVLAVTMSDWNANMVFHDLVRGSLRAHPMQPKLTTEQILYAVYLVKDPATDECVLYDVPVLQWNAEVNKPVHRVAPVSKDQIKAIINKVTQSYGLALKQPGGTIDYMMGHVMTETWASLGAKLSNEQIAIATIMAESIDDNPRQTWEIGSGFGKTILIQTFIMRMLATESNLVIRVVNPVKHLSDRDKSIFEPLWTSMQRRVEFGQYLRAPRQDEQLLSILDEGDVSIFDHARKTFSEIQQQQRFLILTGSLGSSCKNILDLVLEKNAIKTMRYKHDTVQCDFDRTILTDDLVPQIKQECQSRPVLVYGKINNDQVQEMGYVYKFQPDKQEQLVMLSGKEDVNKKVAASSRKLDRLSHFLDALYCNQLKQYPVIIVENETEMRGVDFRAPQKGITFVVMQPFTNERSFIQGMGRVGRHDDAATRWKLEGLINMHDLDAEAQSFIQLVGIANEYEPKKEMKPVGKGKKAVKAQTESGKAKVNAEMKSAQNATRQDGKKQEQDQNKEADMQLLFK